MRQNILITSAGRRVSLVRFFKEAVDVAGLPAKVYCTDLNPQWSSACRVADAAFDAPRVDDAGYGHFLANLIERNDIGLMIPTIDTELPILASLRPRLAQAGCEVIVSDLSFVRRCRDKRLTGEIFADLGIESPKTFGIDALDFPCFAKPYDGSLSKGARRIDTPQEAVLASERDDKIIFMEYLDPEHYREYTVDMYLDREGNTKCIVPRQRIEVRCGEISKGITDKGAVYEWLRSRFRRLTGARGCITVQIFSSRAQDRYVGIEINPRFAGGYPLSHLAGARYTDWLIDEYLRGRPVPFFQAWEDGLAMTRYDAEIVFRT
jgi:carbamoyl-phosphate synthase large subunit